MKELIKQCRQGDREAMGQLYTAMHDELLAQCRKYAANDNIADDLLHDAFLLIFSNIDKVRSPEKGRIWMHKVVRNVCLLYVQHRQNNPIVPIDEVRETAEGTEDETPVTYDDIQRAIDHLPRGYRQVFRLSVLEGLTHRQIAELLGIEPHTSSSQLLRAKRQLRQLLQVLMLFLLAAIPFGGYYFWSLHNSKHDVAEVSDDTTTDTRDIAKNNQEDTEETASSQNNVITDTAVGLPDKGIAENIKAANKQKQNIIRMDSVGHEPVRQADKVEENKTQEKNVEEEENDRIEMNREETYEKVTAKDTEKNDTTRNGIIIPQGQIILPSMSTSNSNFFLSLAYNGLPNGTARPLPYGTEGMNGDIDSVAHHRMPVSVALNARYSLDSHWWIDGGLRYTQLSSETRVGNAYIFMDQQQRVRYLGLSIGVGYNLWNQRHWNFYTTTSVGCDLPLRCTTGISYWQGGRLIDTEKNRLAPHSQWSVGLGVGLQYDLSPSIGFFAEPNLQYYFSNSDGIKTWRTEHPFTPMLPLGIRVSF